ncbi:hypothetical protein ILUMI_17434, partial [Ignelater luminosus]
DNVKCPSTARNLHPKNAIRAKVIKFATFDENDNLRLKRQGRYYYQVQGQLAITQRELCYFIVWTPLGYLVEVMYIPANFIEKSSCNVWDAAELCISISDFAVSADLRNKTSSELESVVEQ